MSEVYLICGLPASGKSWVITQVALHRKGKFRYVPNDKYMNDVKGLIQVVHHAASYSEGSTFVITDCPFGFRERKKLLEERGLTVKPFIIHETIDVLWSRYSQRAHKPLKREWFTSRIHLPKQRALDWRCPVGTSQEILTLLRAYA